MDPDEELQTFVPFEDLPRIAAVLDKKRLWKQVVEAKQILQTLRKIKIREHAVDNPDLPSEVKPDEAIEWENHPAVAMWADNTYKLADYMRFLWKHARDYHGINTEWDNYETICNWARKQGQTNYNPWWWGGHIHYNHRLALCRKDWDHYGGLFPDVFDDDAAAHEYYWPMKDMDDKPVGIQPNWADGLSVTDIDRMLMQGPGPMVPIPTGPTKPPKPMNDTEKFIYEKMMETIRDRR